MLRNVFSIDFASLWKKKKKLCLAVSYILLSAHENVFLNLLLLELKDVIISAFIIVTCQDMREAQQWWV